MIPNQACDPDTGVCRCLPTWEGSKCEIDVDECANETHNCDITMSSCSNVPGGFTCQHFIDPTEGRFPDFDDGKGVATTTDKTHI